MLSGLAEFAELPIGDGTTLPSSLVIAMGAGEAAAVEEGKTIVDGEEGVEVGFE